MRLPMSTATTSKKLSVAGRSFEPACSAATTTATTFAINSNTRFIIVYQLYTCQLKLNGVRTRIPGNKFSIIFFFNISFVTFGFGQINESRIFILFRQHKHPLFGNGCCWRGRMQLYDFFFGCFGFRNMYNKTAYYKYAISGIVHIQIFLFSGASAFSYS